MAAAKKGDWQVAADGTAIVGGQVLEASEFALRLQPREGVASEALRTNDAVVVLDVEVTPELEAEGLARDLVRLVQQARKSAGLHVADRIRLRLSLPDALRAPIEAHRAFVAEQTLAGEIAYGTAAAGMFEESAKLAGETITIALARA
jgi:isoleucyl-tRNA synthetase